MQKLILPVLAATLIGLNACQPANKSEQKATDSVAVATGDTTAMIDAKLPDPASFGGEVEGKKAQLFILKNKDIQVAISNYGARIVGLLVPDKNGKIRRVPGPNAHLPIPSNRPAPIPGYSKKTVGTII